MNAILVSGLTIFAALASATPAPSVANACEPRLIEKDTRFPLRSQMRGQTGTVVIDVVVDENGRAQSAALHQSSGHRFLDQAARNSVMENWLFDVSACARKDLPATNLYAVEYRQ